MADVPESLVELSESFAPYRMRPGGQPSERDRKLNRIVECMAYAESYGASVAESAWRGDEDGLEKHLKAIRVAVMEAIKTFKEVKKLP